MLDISADSSPLPPRGTGVYLIPRHVCPTVNLAEKALLVDGGRIVGEVEIDARAHDLGIGGSG